MNWPTMEELESQQSPFDPNGTFPFDYRIIIVERRDDNVYVEQLRTYKINEVLSEDSVAVPDSFSCEEGRKFRVAQAGETPQIMIANHEIADPIGLIQVEE